MQLVLMGAWSGGAGWCMQHSRGEQGCSLSCWLDWPRHPEDPPKSFCLPDCTGSQELDSQTHQNSRASGAWHHNFVQLRNPRTLLAHSATTHLSTPRIGLRRRHPTCPPSLAVPNAAPGRAGVPHQRRTCPPPSPPSSWCPSSTRPGEVPERAMPPRRSAAFPALATLTPPARPPHISPRRAPGPGGSSTSCTSSTSSTRHHPARPAALAPSSTPRCP